MMQIIAEIGSNWRTLADCRRSIRMASLAGADAVKFQRYTHEELYGTPGDLICDPAINTLALDAKEYGIEFMCTAFSAQGYQDVDPLVKRHKVASSEITDLNILEAVNSFRKPVILSTGGASKDDIKSALLVLRNVPVTLLYCEVEYPARHTDFRRFNELKNHFGKTCKIGYSDHTIDIIGAPCKAQALGAVVIEKHVNFTTLTDTPDAPHSLSFNEFQLMVNNLKGIVTHRDTYKPNPHKRMLVTRKDGTKAYFRPKLCG